jgi:hypothetical protein
MNFYRVCVYIRCLCSAVYLYTMGIVTSKIERLVTNISVSVLGVEKKIGPSKVFTANALSYKTFSSSSKTLRANKLERLLPSKPFQLSLILVC